MVLYLIPDWFYVLGIGMEFAFAVIALLVSLYSFKIYNTYQNKEIGLFSLGFLFISLAYMIKALFNYIVVSQVQNEMRAVALEKLSMLQLYGLQFYLILFIAGLATLAYITLKIDDKKVLAMMLVVSILFVLLAKNVFFSFNILSMILLIYIFAYYIRVYKEKKNKKSLLIMIAFLCLLLSSMVFLYPAGFYFNYVVGHVFELVSYLLIFISLISTVKK